MVTPFKIKTILVLLISLSLQYTQAKDVLKKVSTKNSSLAISQELKSKTNNSVDKLSDTELMDLARQKFAENKLEESIELYSKISSQSDFWLESIEERAWAYTRLNKFENALADMQSVSSSLWAPQVGPETYMLSTFISLKICDFKQVISKMNLFKKRMLTRIEALEKIQDNSLNSKFIDLIPKIKNSELTLMNLGEKAELYPRYFFRDKNLLASLHKNDLVNAEQRLKNLAQLDLAEIQTNLKKMKIIEVEMMQNVLIKNSEGPKNKNLKFSGIDKSQQVQFPITDDEVWIDEVGQYQVKALNCQKVKGVNL